MRKIGIALAAGMAMAVVTGGAAASAATSSPRPVQISNVIVGPCVASSGRSVSAVRCQGATLRLTPGTRWYHVGRTFRHNGRCLTDRRGQLLALRCGQRGQRWSFRQYGWLRMSGGPCVTERPAGVGPLSLRRCGRYGDQQRWVTG